MDLSICIEVEHSDYCRGQHNGMAHGRSDGGGGSYSFGTRDQRADELARTSLEQDNDSRWLELGEQVSLLKSMSSDINKEVKEQNSLLDTMGSNIMSTTDMFSGTLSKIGNMIQSSSSSHMYYLIAFVVFVFLVIYFMMGRK